MPLVPINAAGQYGIVRSNDISPLELPLNAWSSGQNVRMRDGAVEKFLGHSQVFGTPGTAPYFAMPFEKGGVYYWLYASLSKAYAWDGSAHTDLTRASGGDYSATVNENWTGCMLGSIPVLNNSQDVPQMWLPVDLGQRLQALTAWDSTERAGAMRSFRRFLVALDITKNGVSFPQMVKWSHSAVPGAVPSSWDETDETKDAGEYELLDTDGACLDATRMRDDLVVYKEDSCYRMQFIGGIDIFRFLPMFDNFGILSRRCAVEYARGRHAVFALGDIIEHDGVSWRSIVSARVRRWIFNQISPDSFKTSFVALNQAQSEVWFCFPLLGAALPNIAIVWNWQSGAIGTRELSAAHISPGNVVTSSVTWDSEVGSWDSDPGVWGEGASNPAGRRVLLCDPLASKFFMGDSTNQFDAVNMISYIERVSLPIPVTPDGPPDMRTWKFVKNLYPRISGPTGSVVKVQLGKQLAPEAPVSWLPQRDFIIGTTRHIDVRVNAPLLAIRFESTGDIDWKLSGYEVEVTPGGRFG